MIMHAMSEKLRLNAEVVENTYDDKRERIMGKDERSLRFRERPKDVPPFDVLLGVLFNVLLGLLFRLHPNQTHSHPLIHSLLSLICSTLTEKI